MREQEKEGERERERRRDRYRYIYIYIRIHTYRQKKHLCNSNSFAGQCHAKPAFSPGNRALFWSKLGHFRDFSLRKVVFYWQQASDWLWLETQEAAQHVQNVHGFRVRTPICQMVPISRAYPPSPRAFMPLGVLPRQHKDDNTLKQGYGTMLQPSLGTVMTQEELLLRCSSLEAAPSITFITWSTKALPACLPPKCAV